MQQIKFDLELDPVKLLGNVQLVRSIADKKKGPKFYVHAKRKPLQAEVRFQLSQSSFQQPIRTKLALTRSRWEPKQTNDPNWREEKTINLQMDFVLILNSRDGTRFFAKH